MSNRSERFTPLTEQDLVYADFLTNLNTHPVVKDVVRLPNERAIVASMRNLILTNRGERLYQPDLGSSLRSLLFEPLTPAISQAIQQNISETLKVYEPRAKIVRVIASPDEDNNAYSVSVTFYIINKSDPVSFNVTLSRVR